MATEERPTCGAVVCDGSGCHAELIEPTVEEAVQAATEAGWQATGKGHTCPDCAAGTPERSTAEARARGLYGTSRVIIPRAPRDVKDGEPIRTEEGFLIGHAVGDARAGEPVEAKLVPPDAPGRDPKPDERGLVIEDAPWAGDAPWAAGKPS